MKSFFLNLAYGWYQGKGAKYTRKKEYIKALKYNLLSLKYAYKFKDEGEIALELEQVARTLSLLVKYQNALEYAEKSYALFIKIKNQHKEYELGSKRVQKLIKNIKDKAANNSK
jgi:hypothetical protein